MYGSRLVRVPIGDGITAPIDAASAARRGAGFRARLLGLTGDDPTLTVRRASVHAPSDVPIQGALHAAAQLRQAVRAQVNPKMVRRQPQRGIL